jgi:hypothetical protein
MLLRPHIENEKVFPGWRSVNAFGKMTGKVRGGEALLRFCYPTGILMQRSMLGST